MLRVLLVCSVLSAAPKAASDETPACTLSVAGVTYVWTFAAAPVPGKPAPVTLTIVRVLPDGSATYAQARGTFLLPSLVPVPPVPTPPTPEPKPDPQPKPQPPPVGKLFCVVVESTEEPPADIDVAGIRSSPEIREYCKANDIAWRMVDDGVKGPDGKPPAEIASFLTRAAGQKLPRIIVATESGDVLVDDVLPKDAAAVLALLKTLRK